jgi:hypothetical protein
MVRRSVGTRPDRRMPLSPLFAGARFRRFYQMTGYSSDEVLGHNW